MLTVDFAIQAYQSLPVEERQKFVEWLQHNEQPPATPPAKRKRKSNVPSLEETRHIVYKSLGFTS